MNSEVPTLLWERIATYAIDDPASAFPYSRKLARENGWSDQFAKRVIEEYRRFIYLGMVAGHPVAPSDAVDQAWHLHQLYSRQYWDEFCPDILGRPFHHGPSKGGDDEDSKFAHLYEETKRSYLRIFHEPPPEDIWPPTDVQFSGRYVRLDLHEHLVIRTKDFPILSRVVGAILNLNLKLKGVRMQKRIVMAVMAAVLSANGATLPSLPSEPVLDMGHMLTDSERQELNTKTGRFMEKTSMHIRLVTVDDVSPYATASTYAEALYHTWELGDPRKHNGLLLLIARRIGSGSRDMKDYCRIMTGWGTRKILSDQFIVTVVKHGEMMPNLPDRPYQAFDQALTRMFAEIDQWRTQHPDDDTVQASSSSDDGWTALIILVIVIVVVLIIVFAVIATSNGGGGSGSGYYGGSDGGGVISSCSSCSSCGGGCGGGGCSG